MSLRKYFTVKKCFFYIGTLFLSLPLAHLNAMMGGAQGLAHVVTPSEGGASVDLVGIEVAPVAPATPTLVPHPTPPLSAVWQVRLQAEHSLENPAVVETSFAAASKLTAETRTQLVKLILQLCALPEAQPFLRWGQRPFPWSADWYEKGSAAGGDRGSQFFPSTLKNEETKVTNWCEVWNARERIAATAYTARGKWPSCTAIDSHPEALSAGSSETLDQRRAELKKVRIEALQKAAAVAGIPFDIFSEGSTLVVSFVALPPFLLYLPCTAWPDPYHAISRVTQFCRISDHAAARGYCCVDASPHWYLPGTALNDVVSDAADNPLYEFDDALIISCRPVGACLNPVDYMTETFVRRRAVRELRCLEGTGVWSLGRERQSVWQEEVGFSEDVAGESEARLRIRLHNLEQPGGPPIEAHQGNPDLYGGNLWQLKPLLLGKLDPEQEGEREALIKEILADPAFAQCVEKYVDRGLNCMALPLHIIRLLAVQTRLSVSLTASDGERKRAALRRFSGLLKAVWECKKLKDDPEAYSAARAEKWETHRLDRADSGK